jgi:FG-GAP-like repeat
MQVWGRRHIAVVAFVAFGWAGSACQDSPPPQEPRGMVAMTDGLSGNEPWRQDFAFADMDGDGVRDLVTAPPRKSREPWPHIFLRRPGRWEAVACPDVAQNGFPKPEYVYGGVAVADFTGTGKVEIVLAMHETGIRILTNTGVGPCGPWVERTDLPPKMLTMRTRTIAVADMNHDGRLDIVALSEASDKEGSDTTAGVVIFFNEATVWRRQAITGSEDLFGDDVAIGEINGDGVPDIAVGSLNDQRPQFAWLSDGKGGWQAASAEGLPPYIIAWAVQLVDFDHDGKDELLLGVGGAPIHENGGPRVYKWDGTRWNDLSQGLPKVSWVSGVAAADLDRDGKLEIVTAEMYTGALQVYGQQPTGEWGSREQLKVAEEGKWRNYKVRALPADKEQEPLIVANYAGDSDGKLMAWVWR